MVKLGRKQINHLIGTNLLKEIFGINARENPLLFVANIDEVFGRYVKSVAKTGMIFSIVTP